MFDGFGFLFDNELVVRFESAQGSHVNLGFEYNKFKITLTPGKGYRGRLAVYDYACVMEAQVCDFTLDDWRSYNPGIITRRDYILQKFREAFDNLPTKHGDDVRAWALDDIQGQLDDLLELVEKQD